MARGVDLQVSARASEADINRLRRKLQTQINKIRKGTSRTVEDAAKFGQLAAKSAAPNDRGYLIRSIKYRTEKGDRAVVYVDENVIYENPSATHNEGAFNYAYYIHEIDSNYPVNISSGDPKFMEFAMESSRKFIGQKIRTLL